MRKFFAITGFAALMVVLGVAAGQKYADLKFVVLRDYNGKAIRNASVVLHQVDKEGKQSKGGLQLKTDGEGKASYGSVPYGKLRVQVIASGFQTYGADLEIDQPTHEITIRLKRPQEQFSIYKEGPKKDEKKPQGPPPK
jgi:hypothetical protein